MTNPTFFSAREVFDLAVQTEVNGRAFYEAAGKAATVCSNCKARPGSAGAARTSTWVAMTMSASPASRVATQTPSLTR